MISLLPYQLPSAANNTRALRDYRVCIDASDTGTGKTYVNASVVSFLKAPGGVICPKAVVPVWQRTLALAGVEPLFVTNYEKMRTGKTGWGDWQAKDWKWDRSKVPPDTILLWDEAHRCKGKDSLNARMLSGSRPWRNIVMSATLADSPLEMRAVGFLLGLHDFKNWWMWCLKNGCNKKPFGGLYFNKKTAPAILKKLHNYIFPDRGSRIRIKELGNAFPSNSVFAEAYDMGTSKEIQAEYDKLQQEVAELILAAEEECKQANIMALQARMRQATELLKVPGMVAMTEDLIAEGNSVVIFTNYRATLELFCEKLGTGCAIFGGQDPDERQHHIDEFQADRQRVIVVNIAAGGAGISLHDLNGNHPRVSLICPTFSAMDLKQALGRIHRAGAKSPAIQRIVYAAGTLEEHVCKRVQAKLKNLDLLNDGDFDATSLFLAPKRTSKIFSKEVASTP